MRHGRSAALSERGSPVAAILVSGVFVLIAAAASMFTPDAYADLFGVALFAAILVWIVILASHLSFRRQHGAARLPVRMPFFPWMQYAGIAMLVGVLVTMGLDPTLDVSWLYGVPWVALISLAYFVRRARMRRASGGIAVTRKGSQ